MKNTTKYDLEERTLNFSKSIIELCRSVNQDTISRPVINQLVRSATSIGANYVEANGASSRKDFRNKIYIAKKEAREAEYWLKLLADIAPEAKVLPKIQQECHELLLILQKITSTLREEQ